MTPLPTSPARSGGARERAQAGEARTAVVPDGVPVVLDGEVLRLDGGRVLLGGDPGRLVRLRPGAGEQLHRLATGAPVDRPLRALARTLVDGGLAHPRPAPAPARDVTVVVPVRDRTAELDRCLQALGTSVPVLVVDDGSLDPAAVARVAARHRARVLHQPVNTGPAGARNAGIAATTSALVAFVDSDCTVPPGWLEALAGHFADPAVGAVAPRVRAPGGPSLLARYAAARGPLDLGPREARVRPGGRVPYVPTAALVVRREALAGADAFDPGLRFGEDVDLVWRLHDAGWTVRYDPCTVVRHAEPDRWPVWLRRRYSYGTSAAPLARRHPAGRLTPLVVAPWPTAAWLLLAARRPLPALLAAGVPAVRLQRVLRRSGLPVTASAVTAARVSARAVVATGGGLGGAGLVATAPVVVGLLARRRSRAVGLVTLLAPPLLEHLTRRPAVDPVRWTALRLVDDLAYASGVWRGSWSARSTAALRPRRSRPR